MFSEYLAHFEETFSGIGRLGKLFAQRVANITCFLVCFKLFQTHVVWWIKQSTASLDFQLYFSINVSSLRQIEIQSAAWSLKVEFFFSHSHFVHNYFLKFIQIQRFECEESRVMVLYASTTTWNNPWPMPPCKITARPWSVSWEPSICTYVILAFSWWKYTLAAAVIGLSHKFARVVYRL